MRSRLVSPVLVGRREELDLLHAASRRALGGQASVVLVVGEAGVGKTRLVDEALERAEAAGARILVGRCVELGGEGLAFVPIVDALRQLVRSTPASELESLLGPGRGDLARLLPELDPEAAITSADPGAASRLFEFVLGLVGRLAAEQPLVLAVEDLHWADRSTLDLLAFLVRVLRSEAVLLVATYRAEDVGRRHPLRRLLAELERLPNVDRIELPRFGRSEVVQQLRGILGTPPPPRLVDDVIRRSEGNAFFVEELVAARDLAGDQLSPGLRDVLLTRVEGLSPPAQRALQAVSAAGQRVGHPLLAAVAGLDPVELESALREAVEHHVLEVETAIGAYLFRHALMREAVYEDLLPGERVRLHLAYGQALERDATLAEGSAVALLAHHWYAAHDLARALPASIEAAAQAMAAYASAEAAQYLERALAAWSSVDRPDEKTGIDLVQLLELAADATAAAGDVHRATALVDEALTMVDRERDPIRTALLLARRGRPRWFFGPDALADLHEAAGLLPAAAPERAAVLGALAAAALIVEGDFAMARDVALDAAEAARRGGDSRLLADALITLGSAEAYNDSDGSGPAHLEEALTVATEAGHHDTALRAYINLAEALRVAGCLEDAAEVARRGAAFAERIGSKISGIIVTGNLAEILVQRGDWDDAEAVLADALPYAPAGVPGRFLHLIAAGLALGRNDLESAAHHLADLGREHDAQLMVPKAGLVALLAHAEGRLDDARRELTASLDAAHLDSPYLWPNVWLAMRVEADIAEEARARRRPPGDEHTARVDAVAALAASMGDKVPAVRGYGALAAAERLRADGKSSVEAWSAAVDVWRAAGELPRLAYALFRLAEARVASGDRTAASDPLSEAFVIAGGLGASLLLDDIRSLSVRARVEITSGASDAAGDGGGAGRVGGGLDRFRLTPRELEVLRLVADGLGNTDIAARLYISPKTVSVHVSNLIAKLGVGGRGEAAAVAHRLGAFVD